MSIFDEDQRRALTTNFGQQSKSLNLGGLSGSLLDIIPAIISTLFSGEFFAKAKSFLELIPNMVNPETGEPDLDPDTGGLDMAKMFERLGASSELVDVVRQATVEVKAKIAEVREDPVYIDLNERMASGDMSAMLEMYRYNAVNIRGENPEHIDQFIENNGETMIGVMSFMSEARQSMQQSLGNAPDAGVASDGNGVEVGSTVKPL